MATPKVYVICDQNCKFEGMTKEQILTAIVQAVEGGEIKDIDAGFIQTVKTINGISLRFFVGEKSAYDALSAEERENLFAIITNDTTKADLLAEIEALKKTVAGLGQITNAKYAETAGELKELGKTTDNVSRHVWFSDSEKSGLPRKDDKFKYNPITHTLEVDKIKLGSPADLTDNKLSGAGYYLICAYYNSQMLNFGLLYWDGEIGTGATGYGAYRIGIDATGLVVINMLKQDGSYEDITASCEIKIKQIGVV